MKQTALILIFAFFVFIIGFILGVSFQKNKHLKNLNLQNQKIIQNVIKTNKEILNSSDADIYNWLRNHRLRKD